MENMMSNENKKENEKLPTEKKKNVSKVGNCVVFNNAMDAK